LYCIFYFTLLVSCKGKGKTSLYSRNGGGWSGICKTGKFQSPINIMDGVNTEEDTSVISFDYNISANSVGKKFKFDGERLRLDIPLGTLAMFNRQGANEIYNARKIELHFPSEHYVTMNNQTPRYALELQIVHDFAMTSNAKVTNKYIKVNRAVVSILYTVGPYTEGDEFLDELGISRYNMGGFSVGDITQGNQRVGTYDTGFNIKALQGLLNSINSNAHMYYYYGSETVPPCREETLWIIFARPRSISVHQFKFLKALLAKSKRKGESVMRAQKRDILFGNNRRIQPFDTNYRGKVFSSLNGIRQVKQQSYFKKS